MSNSDKVCLWQAIQKGRALYPDIAHVTGEYIKLDGGKICGACALGFAALGLSTPEIEFAHNTCADQDCKYCKGGEYVVWFDGESTADLIWDQFPGLSDIVINYNDEEEMSIDDIVSRLQEIEDECR